VRCGIDLAIARDRNKARAGMSSQPVRFGRFDFFPDSGELLRAGIRVRLQPQPAKVLALLVSRGGALVTREELRREVWGSDTHVDFDRGLNFCIAQIRTALGDSAEGSRYLETVPKQGYRFVAPISSEKPQQRAAPAEEGRANTGSRVGFAPVAVAILSILIVGSIAFVRWRLVPTTVVVIPFYNETGNAASDPTAAGLSDAVVARLAAPERARQLSVIGNAPSLRNPFARQDVQDISRKLGAEYLIIGQLKSVSARLRLVAHLIRVSDMKHLWANTYDDERFALDAQQRVAEAVAGAVSVAVAPPGR
jgi:DNA-binding winged helix-turn-helix (wHTH) protein/TolB-like protein